MESDKFSLRERIKSFVFAFAGFNYFFRHEHNARIHAGAALVVLIIAFLMKLSAMEMISLIIVIGMVWIAEMFNTAIEKIMNHLSPASHPDVKLIKDIAAAGVLVAACVAVITGLIIFIPRFF
ncbi:MAG: diacylglycerol kinase family protein [Chitinophagaceae bacterium]